MDSPFWLGQQHGQQQVVDAGSYSIPGRVLFAAAEIVPFAKTGGLADVAGALPQALAELGADVRLMMPGYPSALEQVLAPHTVLEFDHLAGVPEARIVAGRVPGSALPIWLLDCPSLFRRAGGPYQDPDGRDWSDNAQRFGLFCRAVARIAASGMLGWRPDVVHCHDWHTGLVPLLLRGEDASQARSVFTIHNLAFQGNFPLAAAERLGLPAAALGSDGAEFYGQLSFLKAGIRYADRLTTVSPSYAREITTAEHGCGLHGLLQLRRSVLGGILNGIDTASWNPAADPYLPQTYSVADLTGKRLCKERLQADWGLAVDPQRPLAIMLSRLTGQKMADVVAAELPTLLAARPDLQFALLGQGDRALEQQFVALAAAHPTRVAVRIGYSEPQAHRLQAAGDLLLHGSRFEPCGLTQMYAMRYGTLPVVRRVGGLGDSVIDAGPQGDHPHGTGFVFDACSGDALRDAALSAVDLYRQQPARWRRLQRNAMSVDFGWQRSAREYLQLYGLERTAAPSARWTGARLEPAAH